MLFNSLQFFIFFPIVVGVYYFLPHRYRWLFLLLASIYFYMALVPAYILILGAAIIIDYLAGIRIEQASSVVSKRLFLVVSICSNLGILFLFKYADFASTNIHALAQFLGWNYSLEPLLLILPVGLSFHVFQSLAYIIEVYRGTCRAERNFGIFALYVSFFPQLVAGPIERPDHLLPQFRRVVTFDQSRTTEGLRLMLLGFFKKILIADNAALLVAAAYGSPDSYGGFALAVATLFFAIQIYGDFSGYSDIARGAAKILGFNLVLNFNYPYFARSVSEFWRRWHISLMNWFREYVYFPLGGSHVSTSRWIRNIGAVFLVSGLWHGASWTFIVWGALNGIYVILGKLTEPLREKLIRVSRLSALPRLHGLVQIFITFVLINIAWIFFRAENISEARYIIRTVASDLLTGQFFSDLFVAPRIIGSFPIAKYTFIALVISIVLLGIFDYLAFKGLQFQRVPRPLRLALYYAVVIGILFFGYFGKSAFIYFQF